jgi:hypothetical protein
MDRRGEIRDERIQIKGRRGKVEMSSQGNEGDRIAMYKKTRVEFSGLS